MISKPTNVHKCMKMYYTHGISPTCFGHSRGHLQGGALQRIHTSEFHVVFIVHLDINFQFFKQRMYFLFSYVG
jgi:hypothetical protein